MIIESIKSATADDEAAVISVMTLAFGTDPVARYFYPNPREYLAHFPRLALGIGGKAFANGSAHYAEGFAAAELWLPPGMSPTKNWRWQLFTKQFQNGCMPMHLRFSNRWVPHIRRNLIGICG